MQERHIEFSIPRAKIEDLVAAHLYAITTANHNENIVFTDLGGLGEAVPVKIKLTKEVEVQQGDG